MDSCKMEDASDETHLATNYYSEASVEQKTRKEGRYISEVWEHFTKIMKENGRCEFCKCNYCEKLFSCTNRSGTNHLRRHIAEGKCPVLKREDKMITLSSYKKVKVEHPNALVPLKIDAGLVQSYLQQQPIDVEVEEQRKTSKNPEYKRLNPMKDKHGGQKPLSLPKEEVWMNEFRSCVAELVKLANGRIPVGSLQSLAVTAPDYSIAAALKCLNEMDDIPQSSDMYLDAFDILQDAKERECFISLPPEPRRRWLQRVLYRRDPLRYGSNFMERHHI